MRRPFFIVFVLAVVLPTLELANGAEIRTYQFVPDGSLPYAVSCVECFAPFIGVQADIEGKFTVSLDLDAGTGTLLALDTRLVNVFQILVSSTGPILGPAGELGDVSTGVIPAYLPIYQPPLDGLLTSDDGTLRLVSDDLLSSPDVTSTASGPSYQIAMHGDHASFSLTLPVDEYAITVSNALAVWVIPEPGAGTLILTAFVLLLAGQLRGGARFARVSRRGR